MLAKCLFLILSTLTCCNLYADTSFPLLKFLQNLLYLLYFLPFLAHLQRHLLNTFAIFTHH